MDLSKIEKQIVTLQFVDSSDTATLKIKLSKHLLIGAFKLVLTQVDGSPVRQEGDDASLVEQTTDAILGGESKQVTKGKVNLKYDHSDPDWHIEPIAPVDYSKS